MNKQNTTRNILEWGLFFLLLTIGLIIYYWPLFSSHFNLLIGDDWDGRLNLLLADSWQDFFNGELNFSDLRTFYPLNWMRCGTDLNLTLFLLEQPFRLLGADYIQAGTLVFFLLHFQGGFFAYYLCRKCLKLNLIYSYSGVILLVFSNAIRVKLGHTQFYFLLLSPLLLFLLFQYLKKYHRGEGITRGICGVSAVIVYDMILYSSFYPAFFIVLFFLFFILIGFIQQKNRKRHLAYWINHRGREIFALGIFAGVSLLPFFYLYLPSIGAGGWKMEFIRSGMPILTDIIQCGPHSMMWGRFAKLLPLATGDFTEHHCGVPPFTFILFLFCLCLFFKRKKEEYTNFERTLGYSILFSWISTVSIGEFSLWYVLLKVIPGASAIRSLSRFYLFLTIPISLFILLSLRKMKFSFFPRYCGIIVFFLLLDNLNLTPLCNCNRQQMLERIAAVPRPPAEAKVFVIQFQNPLQVKTKEFPGHPWCEYGLLAMEIAQKYGLFTCNGFTGNVRESSWLFYDPHGRYYYPYVNEWIQATKIPGPVYRYDPYCKLWWKLP